MNGFSTAGGRSMVVSDFALEKAQALFKNIDDEPNSNDSGDNFVDFGNPPGSVPGFMAMGGFNTAGGRGIVVNDAAVAKAQNLFRDLDNDEDTNSGFGKPMGNDNGFGKIGGFNTAGGRKVIINEETMAKAKNLFRDLDNDEEMNDVLDDGFNMPIRAGLDIPKIGGFSTAGGRTMAISENALAKAQTLFKDLEKEDFTVVDSIGTAKTADTEFKTPVNVATAKLQCQNPDSSTPKLPTGSKLPFGRRRLADSDGQPGTSDKKQRMSIFNREDNGKGTSLSSLGLSSPAALSSMPKRGSIFRYNNGKRQLTPRLFLPSSSVETSSISDSGGSSWNDSESYNEQRVNAYRKVELGEMYRLRRIGLGQRQRLSSALAGQTPRSYQREEYERYGVKEATLSVNSANAVDFEFTQEYFITDGQINIGDGVQLTVDEANSISVDEFLRAFMNSSAVDPALISMEWCRNHYRWIVWKEAAMETSFPHLFGGKLLTPHRVMLQLKYRYDREIEKAERSALKRILNGDDTTYRPMVLCVSSVLVKSEPDAMIELTDGWYSIRARLDQSLSRKLSKDQICVGQKLFISRCSIIGLEDGCEPLEVPASVQLVLTVNAVRRARWNATLGYQYLRRVPCFPINSVVIGGGIVAGVEVQVTQIHPLLYMVKTSSGTMILDEKAERREALAFEKIYERCLDKLVEEIEKEFASSGTTMDDDRDQQSNCGSKLIPRTQDIRSICDVEDLYRLFKNAADPAAVAARATSTQKERLKVFCDKMNEQQQCEARRKFESAIHAKAASLPQRKVTPFLKISVAGVHPKDVAQNATSMLTIWRPDDDILHILKQGATYLVTSVQICQPTSAVEKCKIALSTTQETRFIPLIKKKREARV